jgi:hypothetical protein
VAPGPPEVASLAAALAAAPVSGALLLEPEPASAADVEALGRRLAAAGVPALVVARTDAAALERAVIGFIVARGAELERQAALLEAELERRALEGAGAQELVATVATFLGRAVVLESARGEAIAVHAPAEAPAAATEAARYRAQGGAGPEPALRIELPSGAAGPGGRIAALGTEPATDLARVALPRVAGLLALELARDEAVRRAADRARRAEPMPSDGPPWAVMVARQRDPGVDDDGREARDAREAVRREVRLLAPAKRMTLRGDADSLEIRAVVAGDEPAIRDLAERVAALLGRGVAVSRAFTVASERAAAEAEARATLEAALALEAPPPVARADRLAFYRMLGAVHKVPDGPRLARAILEPLLAGRADVRRERLTTLRAVLDHGGIGEAAAALGVHRNTVAYRIRAIEAATGWQLGDPELRLPLAVAVRLVQED